MAVPLYWTVLSWKGSIGRADALEAIRLATKDTEHEPLGDLLGEYSLYLTEEEVLFALYAAQYRGTFTVTSSLQEVP